MDYPWLPSASPPHWCPLSLEITLLNSAKPKSPPCLLNPLALLQSMPQWGGGPRTSASVLSPCTLGIRGLTCATKPALAIRSPGMTVKTQILGMCLWMAWGLGICLFTVSTGDRAPLRSRASRRLSLLPSSADSHFFPRTFLLLGPALADLVFCPVSYMPLHLFWR